MREADSGGSAARIFGPGSERKTSRFAQQPTFAPLRQTAPATRWVPPISSEEGLWQSALKRLASAVQLRPDCLACFIDTGIWDLGNPRLTRSKSSTAAGT